MGWKGQGTSIGYIPRGSQGLWYRNPPKVQTCWYAIMLCKGVRLTIHALDGVTRAQAQALQSNGTHATQLGQKITVLPPRAFIEPWQRQI